MTSSELPPPPAAKSDDHRDGAGASPGGTHGPPPRSGLDGFFDQLRRLDLRRDGDRWIGGVCSGIAARAGVDPLIVRAGAILLGLAAGFGVTIYLVAWLLLPDERGQVLAERAVRQRDGGAITLMVFTGLALLTGSGFALGWGDGSSLAAVPVLVVVGGVWWLLRRNQSTSSVPGATPATGASRELLAPQQHGDTPTSWGAGQSGAPPYGGAPPPGAGYPYPDTPAPRRPRRRPLGAGLSLALLGLATAAGFATPLVLSGTQYDDVAGRLVPVIALAALGVGLVVVGLMGRRAGLPGLIALALMCTALVVGATPKSLPLHGEAGEAHWRPTVLNGRQTYTLAGGEGTLDLRGLRPGTSTVTVPARVTVGELKIVVPDDLTVRVRSAVSVGGVVEERRGYLSAEDGESSTGGLGHERTVTVGSGPPDVVVDARVGVGTVRIEKE